MVQYNAISFFFSHSPPPRIPRCLCAAACLQRRSQRTPQRAVCACAPAPVNLRRSDIVFWMLNWMQASRLICIRCANTLDDVLIHGTTNKPFRAIPCLSLRGSVCTPHPHSPPSTPPCSRASSPLPAPSPVIGQQSPCMLSKRRNLLHFPLRSLFSLWYAVHSVHSSMNNKKAC